MLTGADPHSVQCEEPRAYRRTCRRSSVDGRSHSAKSGAMEGGNTYLARYVERGKKRLANAWCSRTHVSQGRPAPLKPLSQVNATS